MINLDPGWLKKSWVGIPTLAGLLVFGLILLFFRDLDTTLRMVLVPSVAIYILGNSLLAFVYSDLDARNCVRARQEEGRIPGPISSNIFILFIVLHVVWFVSLLIYLFWKGIL